MSFSQLDAWLPDHPLALAALGLGTLLLLAWLLQLAAHFILLRVVGRAVEHVGSHHGAQLAPRLLDRAVLRRMAQVVPALVVQVGVRFVPDLPETLSTVIGNVAAALTVLAIARVLIRLLDNVLAVDSHRAALRGSERPRSFKSYLQLAQIVVGAAAVVIMIAALADKSPLIVLSGFGAMSAVLMLVFQDTIKSFAAGLQLESNDMLRVGDWIEVPQAGADGDVIDVALNTVKVQNFDKTIVTIPTWKLMSESFRNWRGMKEAGGRRIKRTLMIDAGSIGFLDDGQIDRLGRIELIAAYVKEKSDAVKISRAMKLRELGEVMGRVPANQRRLTNIGTFRAYVQAYLKANSGIHPDMTLMVRMLQPTTEGVPLELYCFTNTTAWVDYEAIQSDIFDHLLAILPEFGLRVFQNPSGGGLYEALAEWRSLSAPQAQAPASAPAHASPAPAAPDGERPGPETGAARGS